MKLATLFKLLRGQMAALEREPFLSHEFAGNGDGLDLDSVLIEVRCEGRLVTIKVEPKEPKEPKP